MHMMTSQILKRYLENETIFFLQIKEFINFTLRATLLQKTPTSEVAFIQKKHSFFGLKLGLNCLRAPRHRVLRNFHIAHNKIIVLCFGCQVKLLGICRSLLYLKEATTFFRFRTQLGPF